MQFVNDTDETIEIEPGEGIGFAVQVENRDPDGHTWRVVADEIRRDPVDVEELPTIRDLLDAGVR